MKKLIIPAIVIAAIGGYFYYQNMQPVTTESSIAQEVDSAVQEAGAAMEETADKGVVAANDVAGADGDVFADAPEQMAEAAEEAADETMDAAEEAADETMDAAEEAMDTVSDKAEEMAEEVDHANE
ncbi:hypothetical protein [Microbulbifer hainanensis]|uniref:hypothetical protein n=1 Tax=Microbulbifer hainanensis TaxID=2735675 RepID=UPI001867A576|nr:hypothetical protein [Microbulbifer hainanensis]